MNDQPAGSTAGGGGGGGAGVSVGGGGIEGGGGGGADPTNTLERKQLISLLKERYGSDVVEGYKISGENKVS